MHIYILHAFALHVNKRRLPKIAQYTILHAEQRYCEITHRLSAIDTVVCGLQNRSTRVFNAVSMINNANPVEHDFSHYYTPK